MSKLSQLSFCQKLFFLNQTPSCICPMCLYCIGKVSSCSIISIKHYIKSYLELQREITLIELAPSPYLFVLSICLAYMNMFARFDENPAMTLQDIKETKRYGRTHGRTDNVKTVYPPQTKFVGGYNKNLTDKW